MLEEACSMVDDATHAAAAGALDRVSYRSV